MKHFTDFYASQHGDLSVVKTEMGYIPYVMQKTGQGERAYDIFARMLKERIIFLANPIDNDTANGIVAQLLFLQTENSDADISMYINSPGGSVYSGLGILDTMEFIRNDVCTVCVGLAASMAAVILAAGTKGKRKSLPRSRIMIHQPSGGAGGQASDIQIQAKELIYVKNQINEAMSEFTGQSINKIEVDMDRDFFMSPNECVEYGIIDQVIKNIK